MVNLFKVGLLCSSLILQELSVWHIMWDGVGTLRQSYVQNITNKNFFLGFGPWGKGFSGWQCYHKVVFRSRRFAHVSPKGCLLLKTPRSERVTEELKLSLFFEKKNLMISSGYPMGTHQISQEKNDTRHKMKCTCLWASCFSKCLMRFYTL